MRLDRAASIEDLRDMARRRIPRFAFDLVDGGAESERNMRRNIHAFEELELTPRYMRDVADIDTCATILGQTFDQPFGMAPIGMLNAFWPDADLTLARLCKRENVPYVASSASSTTLERLAEAADGNGWFQLYVSSDAAVTEGLIARAEAAQYDVMVVTADVPAAGKRDRDIRNQLSVPFRFTPEVILQLMANPTWALTSLRYGKPNIANYADLLKAATSYADVQKTLITPSFTWDKLSDLRERWKGKLLVKGILHPDDALRCAQIGCDGIIVSNHGGRQVAFGPPTIEALPAIAKALDGKLPIILDSGVRRGADLLRAKALGADFVLAGRALAYGVGAGAGAGAERAFEILKLELLRALGQLGATSFQNVGPADLTKGPSHG
ncbi:alpha-hydroxy acid oxidase [Yoonia sediminilitoris]|uniref:L-lactate dehydrogenase (Cytochrome)/(S)-mandelate dehydrogenase n=1 Tax=Yoonia sediminilitoris TaxID=1286148 RepID=A0A2T6K9T7_9RHOB|nr:alpha-hydroxy acid oxidase [Yoonia sediminilitoris]PUB11534.1 L-lactate dehydrogenase (cytochrome)/(S)-mandelate dehydrogenase [Yoonia sediminilitoris]RCW91734.1 L-lactate dehydrogenase (cytochrome)/(S)-mandelate dehydrogenase [Yoonia sediminilitoris]